MFHHEDPSSPTRTKRRAARPRSTPTPLSSPSIKSEEGSRLSSPSLVLELSETKQNVSVCLLLDRFSAVLLDGPALGFLSCLPGLYADVPPDHCIVQATEALAYAHLAQEPRGRPSERSKWMYATALKSTNMALSSPRTAADDTTIAAVLFLAIYEVSGAAFHPMGRSGLTDPSSYSVPTPPTTSNRAPMPGTSTRWVSPASSRSGVQGSSVRDAEEISSGLPLAT